MSSRKQARLEAKQFIDTLSVQPYPNSTKVYVEGSRPDIRVPMREISLADSLIGGTKEAPILSRMSLYVFMTPLVYIPIQITLSTFTVAYQSLEKGGLKNAMILKSLKM